ncbi:MAG: dihydrofolate reductase [Myxococcales bacterium]|nr:dihydrofolate reductase [Myxococcales bacterium]
MSTGLIAAVNPDGVIGQGNRVPWYYPADLTHFKRTTLYQTVIMGRRTFESIGRALPNRRNIVVTSSQIDGVICVPSVLEAMNHVEGDGWFIGGRRIYEAAMDFADVIDLTRVPDPVEGQDLVHFPAIDLHRFEPGPMVPFREDPRLIHQVYRRRILVDD